MMARDVSPSIQRSYFQERIKIKSLMILLLWFLSVKYSVEHKRLVIIHEISFFSTDSELYVLSPEAWINKNEI